jgi:signal transduction histidine kinase/DNA-binding NarL/FixJ family response regulator
MKRRRAMNESEKRNNPFRRTNNRLIATIIMLIASALLYRVSPVFNFGGVFDAVINWGLTILSSLFIYLLTRLALKNATSALDAQNSFSSLLAVTPNLTVLVDELNRVTYMSKALLDYAGFKNWRIVTGRPIFDFFPPEFKMLFAELLVKDSYFKEIRELAIDGKTIYLKVATGKLYGGTKGRFINITDVSEITKALVEAEASNKAKSQFLATMSHELRTPLNAIIGLSEIELQKAMPQATFDNFTRIHESGSVLLSIINDILDISKIESGSFEIIPVNYDTPSLINDTVQLNIVRIGSKPIDFLLNIDENIPQNLFGDELRVKQILNNILSNAFKYTKKGSVSLSITWGKDPYDILSSPREGLLTFVISDSGIGIREEDIGKLFSEYTQVNTKANRKIEGTGLGLSITKNLVELMGGSISVTSEYGKGSTFTVAIRQGCVKPVAIGKETAEKLRSFRHLEAKRNIIQLRRRAMPYGKVLVVDDVPTNLDVARGLLLPYKLQIDCALEGKEAIKKIRSKEMVYDLIFMDHMMPEMDGVETVRIIRNEIDGEYAKNVPIVALTANAITGTEDMLLAAGFNGFISKPIDIVKLDQALNKFVKKETAEDGAKMDEQLMRDEMNIPWEPVSGMDFSAGMERFGDAAMYLNIIRSFTVNTPAMLNKITVGEAIAEKISGPAFRNNYAITVHGIKSSARSIGALAAGDLAEKLETASRASDNEFVTEHNDVFIDMMETLLSGLRSLLEKVDAEHKKEEKAAPDAALLGRLKKACAEYDMVSIDAAMEELEKYSYTHGGDLIDGLHSLIESSDFENALKKLAAYG